MAAGISRNPMSMRSLAIFIVILFCAGTSLSQSSSKTAAFDAYLQPYVQSGNFAGDVLVERNGKVVFEKAYGFADRERRIQNIAATRFHVASISMQFAVQEDQYSSKNKLNSESPTQVRLRGG